MRLKGKKYAPRYLSSTAKQVAFLNAKNQGIQITGIDRDLNTDEQQPKNILQIEQERIATMCKNIKHIIDNKIPANEDGVVFVICGAAHARRLAANLKLQGIKDVTATFPLSPYPKAINKNSMLGECSNWLLSKIIDVVLWIQFKYFKYACSAAHVNDSADVRIHYKSTPLHIIEDLQETMKEGGKDYKSFLMNSEKFNQLLDNTLTPNNFSPSL